MVHEVFSQFSRYGPIILKDTSNFIKEHQKVLSNLRNEILFSLVISVSKNKNVFRQTKVTLFFTYVHNLTVYVKLRSFLLLKQMKLRHFKPTFSKFCCKFQISKCSFLQFFINE